MFTYTCGHEIAIELPAGWQTRSAPDNGIVAMSRPRRAPTAGALPEIVVRARTVADDLVGWRREALDALAQQLDGFDLEDDDEFELGRQHVRYHRFAHRLGTTELISEQWSCVADALGITITGTVAREEYPKFCDLFEEVASTLDVAPTASLAGQRVSAAPAR